MCLCKIECLSHTDGSPDGRTALSYVYHRTLKYCDLDQATPVSCSKLLCAERLMLH